MWHTKKKGKRRKKTPLQRLEKKADDLTRDIIRLRDEWTCQCCGKHITMKQDAHRAHIVGRKNKILRWVLLNLLLLCFHCHQKYHSDGQLKEYVKEKWPARYMYLYECPFDDIPRCNQKLPYRTPVEKIEWMQNIITELEDKYEALKG